MKSLRRINIVMILSLTALILLSGCSEGASDDEGSFELSGSLATSGASSKLQEKIEAQAVSDYVVYCVTFSDNPQSASSDISAAGDFSLRLPLNTTFGCFINDSATNAPVATMVVEDSAGGNFGGSSSSSMNLSSNVNLGNLTLDLDTGRVAIPIAAVSEASNPVTSELNPTDLHQKAYTMSCISTGDLVIDAACTAFLNDNENQSVYFRIMQASSGSDTIYGLGVWKAAADFTGCGSLDMLNSEQSAIETEDSISFTSVSAGASFTNNQGTCPTRDGLAPDEMGDLENYYAAGPLVPSGSGYNLYVEDDGDNGSGCNFHHSTSVSFQSESSTTLIGNFTIAEYTSEDTAGDCSGADPDMMATFMVRFTQQ